MWNDGYKDGWEESGEDIYEDEMSSLFLPSQQFWLFSFPSRRIRRPDPTGRLILVGDGGLFNATAYAVEAILRGDLGVRETWGSWKKKIIQSSRILIN